MSPGESPLSLPPSSPSPTSSMEVMGEDMGRERGLAHTPASAAAADGDVAYLSGGHNDESTPQRAKVRVVSPHTPTRNVEIDECSRSGSCAPAELHEACRPSLGRRSDDPPLCAPPLYKRLRGEGSGEGLYHGDEKVVWGALDYGDEGMLLGGKERESLSPVRSNIFPADEIDVDKHYDGTTVTVAEPSECQYNWTCSVCTFSNNPLLESCEICDAARSGPFSRWASVESPEQESVPPPAYTVPSPSTLISTTTAEDCAGEGVINLGNSTNAGGHMTRQDTAAAEGGGQHLTASSQDGNCGALTAMYELISVVRHVGPTAVAGHYTCDVKRSDPVQSSGSGVSSSGTKARPQKSWSRCDDAYIYDVSEVRYNCDDGIT